MYTHTHPTAMLVLQAKRKHVVGLSDANPAAPGLSPTAGRGHQESCLRSLPRDTNQVTNQVLPGSQGTHPGQNRLVPSQWFYCSHFLSGLAKKSQNCLSATKVDFQQSMISRNSGNEYSISLGNQGTHPEAGKMAKG